jgi:hypothetical protein
MDLSFHIPAWLAAILLQPVVGLLLFRLRVAWKLDGNPDPAAIRHATTSPMEALPPPDGLESPPQTPQRPLRRRRRAMP